MKKLLITLTMLFAVINIMAQEHLSFKGIPIEGSMTAFCQKLKAKGFTQMGRDNNVTMFTGDFTGRQADRQQSVSVRLMTGKAFTLLSLYSMKAANGILL